MSHGGNLFEQLDVADQRGDLGRDRDEHANLVGRKNARLRGLDDQHSLQGAALEERDAQKRVIGIFPGLGKI